MTISREDVLRVAELAHLELAEGEIEKYREQLDSIIEYIGKLNELNTAGVEPMAQVFAPQTDEEANSTLREDVVVPCDVAADILKQAPDAAAPYFRVPKVIEREAKEKS
jgi:aspartyl-tRNA(Asn)/glutamyl-tRNA(Gln) amidotransferase subunit C